MKLECSTDILKEAVSQVEKIASKNSSLEVLNSILLSASQKTLTLKSTNLSLGIEIEIPAYIEKEGEMAVSGSILSNTILNITGEKIIKLEQKENTLVVSNKYSSITLKSVPHEDFPALPRVDGSSFEILSKDFIEGIRAVSYSSAVSDIKPEISSVFLYTNEKTMVFVATDSFRLAEKSIKNKHEADITSLLIPYKNIIDIVRVLGSYSDTIQITYSKNQISFTAPGFYLTSRIIDGVFPDYRQIIPREAETTALVLKNDIQNALKLSSVFSDKFNQITLHINPEKKLFEIYSENKDVGENRTSLEGSLKGKEISINVNLKYFLDCFQSIEDDSVTILCTAPNRPIIIKGVSDSTFQYLIMPMNR